MHEARVVEVQPARRVLPSQVERDPVHRLAIAQPVEPLEHHHHRHDPGRHRPSADAREQIGERFVGKQTMALAVQQAVD